MTQPLTAGETLKIEQLALLSGRPVPAKIRHFSACRVVDAMLDGHFHFPATSKVALGAEPDLLWSAAQFLAEMSSEGWRVMRDHRRVTAARALPAAEVIISDLEDFEFGPRRRLRNLLMTHSMAARPRS
ncbi:MAG: hypothetical protein IPM01_13715, partial [Burkholderiaceae bacterium]|nr:hypothetical protein [Burkholderiaceae bacterium]